MSRQRWVNNTLKVALVSLPIATTAVIVLHSLLLISSYVCFYFLIVFFDLQSVEILCFSEAHLPPSSDGTWKITRVFTELLLGIVGNFHFYDFETFRLLLSSYCFDMFSTIFWCKMYLLFLSYSNIIKLCLHWSTGLPLPLYYTHFQDFTIHTDLLLQVQPRSFIHGSLLDEHGLQVQMDF